MPFSHQETTGDPSPRTSSGDCRIGGLEGVHKEWLELLISSASLNILNTSWPSISKCALRLSSLFSSEPPPHKQRPGLTASAEASTTRDPVPAALDTAARPTSEHYSLPTVAINEEKHWC